MEQLYQALLHLLPGDFRDEFGSEMFDVFQQAAGEARCQGSVAYGVFVIREIAGLIVEALVHRTQLPRRALLIPACALGGFLASLFLVFLLGPNTYTSVAILRVTRGGVSERIVPSADAMAEANLRAAIGSSFTRPTLVNIINTLELYTSERRRLPMEQIVQRMKEDIRFTLDGDGRGIMISFRHPEPELAQKVGQSLTSRLMNHFQRFQSERTELTETFLKEQTEAAAAEWQRQLDLLRKSDALSKERLALDTDLARQQYITLKEKLAGAALSNKLLARMQGPTMEVIEAASLPESPDRNRTMVMVAGTLGGALFGALLAWLGPIRLRKRAALIPPVQ